MEFIKDTLRTAFSSDSNPVDAWVSCVIIGVASVFIILTAISIIEALL